MDNQSMLNLVLGTASTVLGWLARELWAAVKELRKDLSELREAIPDKYVTKFDFTAALAKVEAGLQRIYDKLDGKADK